VPPSKVATFIADGMAEIAARLPDCLPVAYGHVGDGNIHFNVLPPAGISREERDAKLYLAKTTLNAIVDRYAGGISAEHGIGRLKRDDFAARRSAVQQDILLGIKALLDPADLFNPGCQTASPRDGTDVTVF
jgi:FAD/FMN-containing dehydrogenase